MPQLPRPPKEKAKFPSEDARVQRNPMEGAKVEGDASGPNTNDYHSMLNKDIAYNPARINSDPFKRATIHSGGKRASLDMDINQPVMDQDQSLQQSVGPRVPKKQGISSAIRKRRAEYGAPK